MKKIHPIKIRINTNWFVIQVDGTNCWNQCGLRRTLFRRNVFAVICYMLIFSPRSFDRVRVCLVQRKKSKIGSLFFDVAWRIRLLLLVFLRLDINKLYSKIIHLTCFLFPFFKFLFCMHALREFNTKPHFLHFYSKNMLLQGQEIIKVLNL